MAEQSSVGESAGFILKTTGSHFAIYGATSGSALGIYDYNAGAERVTIGAAGTVTPGADNTQDLGSPAKRWANVYTGDLHLSNSGSGNSVDGTSGSWTMQEGESDLFLINNNTGKKYKFNLTEVS